MSTLPNPPVSASKEQAAQTKEDNTAEKTQRGDFRWLHFFVNPNKKHALGYLVATVVAGVAGFFFQQGLVVLKSMIFPDPSVEKLAKIQASSDSIHSAVEELKSKLNSTEPLDAQAVMAKLNFIAEQNTSLLPLAQGLANASAGYVRGAKVKTGPFDGKGSFYLDLNHGKSGGMTQLCDSATVTYNQSSQQFRLDYMGRSDTRGLRHAGALKVNGVSVVVHSGFDSNGSLQVTYDCNIREKA